MILLFACTAGKMTLDTGCERGTEDCPALSCDHVLEQSPESEDGLYWLIRADESDTYPAWCDMSTADGGWTLVWKQVGHASTSLALNPELAGSPLLQTPAMDGSSSGSLMDDVPHEELLFLSDPELWVHIEARVDSFGAHDELPDLRCTPLAEVDHTCTGVDCEVYAYLALDTGETVNQEVSGLQLGGFSSTGGGPACGGTWCSPTRHGRYDGSCQSGPKGEGDWLLFVR